MASITNTKAVNLVVNKIDKANYDSMRTAGTITDTMAADELWMGDGRLVSDSDLTAHTGDSNIHTTAAEKAKLSGIAAGANNYTHPSSHPPSIITQDASNRFVTDTEKATWNAKETTAGSQAKVDAHIAVKTNPHGVTKSQVGLGSVNDYGIATQAEAEAGTSDTKYMTPLSTKQAITKAAPVNATTSVSGLMSSTDKSKLDGVATGANNYIHPATDGNLHVPATGTTNSGKVLKAGSTAGSLSWSTLTAADVGAAPTSHTHSYVPTTTTVNGKALSANIAITAADVSAYSKAEIDGKIVDNLTTGGATSMLSAEQGKVLGASVSQLQSSISSINVSWDGITGKPTTFTPAAHGHDGFIARSGDGSAVYLNGVDLDNVVITGLYRGTGCSNQPSLTAGWFYMTVISHGSTWVYQELVDLHNSNRKFIRHRYSGVWSAWTDPFGIVVNGKQEVVNAINGSLGYASGLTTSHTHDDYAWWIQNKVNGVKDIAFERMMSMYAAGYFSSTMERTTIPYSIKIAKTIEPDASGKYNNDVIILPEAGSYILIDGGYIGATINPPADHVGSINVISSVIYSYMSGIYHAGTLVRVVTPGKFYNIRNTNYGGFIYTAIYLTPNSMKWLKGEI